MVQLIQHHVKYEEIHGVDEIKIMTRSEHTKLHNRLRREGKCNVPAEKLNKISTQANRRTPSGKATKLHNSFLYRQKTARFYFRETLTPNVALIEEIMHNPATNHISVSSYFKTDRYNSLKYINMEAGT